MARYTFVVEVNDDVFPIEKVCEQVLREDKPGQLIYAYKTDAVADMRHILANSGTPERLSAAVDRVGRSWWAWV